MGFVNHIHIQGFKSIREAVIQDCRRINLFIGKPNVGKSNILEALSLFSIPFIAENSSRKLTHLLRLEHAPELFFRGDTDKDVVIDTNLGVCRFGYSSKEGLRFDIDFYGNSYHFDVDDKLLLKRLRQHYSFVPPIKKYQYKNNVVYRKGHGKYLIPPFGANLLSIIEEYDDLKLQVIKFFADYNLRIVFDKSSQTLKIIDETSEGIFLIPYNSVADTLQRIIFYKAAIVSNNNSILLFEEPEAHSFPPYMTYFTQEMIRHRDNQYFIATHSPFILNELLENSRDELAVYVIQYKVGQTVIRPLSEKELHEVYQYGVDVFTNNEMFD